MSFLTAEWRKLILVNYTIDPSVLLPYLPAGTELDLFNNKCYISLVGFMFLNTKILGVKIPYHINFEEVNLRFYVKRKENNDWKRGVVFIKEIVPKHAITVVANTVYKENYETMPMQHHWQTFESTQEISYVWSKNGQEQSVKVTAENHPQKLIENSETEFITEHYWGYAQISKNKTNEYEVKHPRWHYYNLLDTKINVDYTHLYGSSFSVLDQTLPTSIYLVEGSEISVENKRTLTA